MVSRFSLHKNISFFATQPEGNQTCVLINLDEKGDFKSETVPCPLWTEKNLSKPWELYYPNLPNILVLMWVKQK